MIQGFAYFAKKLDYDLVDTARNSCITDQLAAPGPTGVVYQLRPKPILFAIPGLLKAELVEDKQELIICRLSVLGWLFNFYPLRQLGKRKPKDQHREKNKRKKKGFGWKPSRNQINALLKAITLKELRIDLDTGNWVTNAKLYPVFWWMNRIKGEWQVNFEHHNAIRLRLRTQPYRLIKAMFNP
ncbi:hypothetical protein [Aureitalea marina]|uniref:hypothetical protein n=1 Tax=Aureitalea marina TaxID=930804 RepID=UPI0011AFF203|nr:hypothetical protein [Aureitalea marina]